MSYANGTQYYNLPQTVGTDKRDWFDTNSAFAAVDAALHAAATGQAADAEAISTINSKLAADEADIAALQTASTTQAASISTLQTTVNAQASQIADVRQDAEDMITANNEGAAATSTRAYAIGDYFIYNDVLYKATAAIAIGDTIVPNTNCEATNVDTEITAVKSALTDKLDKAETVLATVTADGSKTYSQLLTSLGLPTNRRSKLRIVSADQSTIDYFEFMQGTVTKAVFIGFSNEGTNNFYRVDVVSSTNSSIFLKIALGTSGNTFTDMSATAVTSGTKFQYII